MRGEQPVEIFRRYRRFNSYCVLVRGARAEIGRAPVAADRFAAASGVQNRDIQSYGLTGFEGEVAVGPVAVSAESTRR